MIDAWNAGPATSFVLSVDYKDADFGGDSLTWTQSSNCGKFQAAGMPSGWNDVISSLVTSTGLRQYAVSERQLRRDDGLDLEEHLEIWSRLVQ